MKKLFIILAFLLPIIGFGQQLNLNNNAASIYAQDSATFTGKLTSQYFIAQANTNDSTLVTTSANTYYTFTGWRDTISENFTITDSSIVGSSTCNGFYHVDCHMSFTYVASQTVHVSLFINDVEMMSSGEFERKLGTSNDIGAASFMTRVWIPNDAVLKVKIKGTSVGGTITVNHGGFGLSKL